MGGLLHLLVTSFLLYFSRAEATSAVGVNYGQLGNNLPLPPDAVRLIKSRLSAGSVKLYDANPQILRALSNTGLEVCTMVPNELIANISADQALADRWVGSNIVPFYPVTRIRHVLVGNEILSDPNNRWFWLKLVSAMRRVQKALKKNQIRNVKVGTSMAIDTLELSSVYPPSNGSFRSDISGSVMKPMLQFLSETKSYLYFDPYPYFHWAKDPEKINLDYALLESKSIRYTDPGTGLVYTNLFDQMVDSMVFAMEKLGYPNIRILMAETGWPSSGDYDQIGANIYNAATYNRNLVKKLKARPPVGTPARPGQAMQGFIFALFNENQKPGPTTERHFGLLYPNGSRVYEIDLSGKAPSSGYELLPAPTNNKPYKGRIWCVVAPGSNNRTALEAALTHSCSQGNGTCEAIRPGKACHEPDSVLSHVSYGFSSYWAQFRKSGASCFFNGLATQTIKDPSHGSCKFPSVTL
ncbi:probable glucan endo-1,3-beta-glucosidase A6 [Rhodamnia argentea]|uniref:glucan endo-1,3-beta-D-glucosidase n=1 Tax=Rhodamnia argentea TaxID=178133 RepID=A0A8B8PF86_9MYRT|nr:probable glucan endo-1,3-beta-glucosidase A6 [Rhodamnia argentea]